LKIVHDPGEPLFHWMPMDEALELGITSFEHAKAPWPVVLKDDLKKQHDKLVGPEANEMAQMFFMMKVADLGVEAVSSDRLLRLVDLMREKEAFLCPTLQIFSDIETHAFEQVKREMQMEELPEQMKDMIKKTISAMEEVSRFFVSELAGQGVRLLVGQDGFEPSGTFEEMCYMQSCGVSESEIIKGATIYPAQWLEVDDRLGSIAPGKQANILVLDANPLENIEHMKSTFLVIRNGRTMPRIRK